MNPSTRDEFVWLISEAAAPVLAHVQSEFEDRVNVVRIAKSLRKTYSPSQAAVIMEQAQLRIRARRKFPNASRMFFTRRGLEQASGKPIADYKAARWANQNNVADICCGIGGDLIALAQRNGSQDASNGLTTIGIDTDELTSLFAQSNLSVNVGSSNHASVRQIDFSDFDVSGFDAIHIDPDRRMKSRTVQGNQFSPNLQHVFEKVAPNCNLAVKVAPATPPADYFPNRIQREWIGDHRECKQQVLWSGPATDKPGHRTATLIKRNGSVFQISVDENDLDSRVEVTGLIQRYLVEPHPSVLAAKLTDHVARRFGLSRFTADIVYLTGDQLVSHPLLTPFEVIKVMTLDPKQIIKFLTARGVGRIEVKRRGVEEESGRRFERLKLNGPHRATVILTRLGRTRIAIIAQRVER